MHGDRSTPTPPPVASVTREHRLAAVRALDLCECSSCNVPARMNWLDTGEDPDDVEPELPRVASAISTAAAQARAGALADALHVLYGCGSSRVPSLAFDAIRALAAKGAR